jgi:hypothetical protein
MQIKSCKITAELIDKKQFIPLSIAEKLQLQTHKAMCKTCNAYENQSKLLDKLLGKWFAYDKSKGNEKLDFLKKNQIIEKIKNA